MTIEHLHIAGLNGRETPINIKFNKDINVFTGKNGCGKTTVLKVIWYAYSGNIERLIREIEFTSVKLVTSKYILSINKELFRPGRIRGVDISLHAADGKEIKQKKSPIFNMESIEQFNMLTCDLLGESCFLPTFRRIEGGFSMSPTGRHSFKNFSPEEKVDRLQIDLHNLSDRLSVYRHQFVASISTVDITSLLAKKFNEAYNQVDEEMSALSSRIIDSIKEYKLSTSPAIEAGLEAAATLDKIKLDVERIEQKRDEFLKPLTVVTELIRKMLRKNGIRFSEQVTIGDVNDSINSDHLSAGEKQLLSFLCYNAFFEGCPIFIDEPELSLHIDWQRILVKTLQSQGTNNQLFIATHSPFIYSKYEDKEHILDSDRGYFNE